VIMNRKYIKLTDAQYGHQRWCSRHPNEIWFPPTLHIE